MLISIEKLGQQKEAFWINYWLDAWRTQPSVARQLALGHLSAYLQEGCLQVARRYHSRFGNTRYGLEDYFQIAMARIERILEGYHSCGASFKNFANVVFSNNIVEAMRQQREFNICSPWSLLRKVSQRRIKEVLVHTGYNPDQIEHRLTAWLCFKDLYIPSSTKSRLHEPNPQLWQRLWKEYCRRMPRVAGQASSPEQLRQWLIDCANAVRMYLFPTFQASSEFSSDPQMDDWMEQLPQNRVPSLWEGLVLDEDERRRRLLCRLLRQILATAIAQFEARDQELLKLYYGEDWTQQQLAGQFQMRQDAVCRRLQRLRIRLVTTVGQWCRQHLEAPLSEQVLEEMDELIEEWLEQSYGPPQAE